MTKWIQLTIKRTDGSVYWVENFADLNEKDKWLNEEMTRPYWDKTYTTEVVDQGAILDAQFEARKLSPEALAQKAKDDALNAIKAKHDGLKGPADIAGLPEAKLLMFEMLQRIKKLEGN